MTPGLLVDDEFVYRHIPGGTTFQAPGPRITSKNFTFRTGSGHRGLSVSRARMTNAEQLVTRIGNELTGSRVAIATIGDIRALGYDVIADPLPEDAGHALIVSGSELIDAREACRRLATLFQFIDLP